MKIEGIKGVLSYNKINRKNLLALLKTEARLINIQDIIQASSFTLNDAKYVQGSYRKTYIEAYNLAFIIRIKEVKEHLTDDNEYLDVDEVHEAIFAFKPRNSSYGAR